MKVKTYYLNELTGEVFTNRATALASECTEAKRLEEEIQQDLKLISEFCEQRSCSECPFCRENEACIIFKFRN